jgi:UDP-GlcNAc:undecaprenyl-phosphate/decaprenyl-phosphate GlcNAc-1-phosphate transferase
MSLMVVTGLAALVVSFSVTLVCERLAPRFGLVAIPRNDRWHRAPVPLLGGVAIVAGTLIPLALSGAVTRDLLVLILAAGGIACVGLLDDITSLKPQLKLVAQVVGAAALIAFGLELRLTPFALLNLCLTLVWVVGITNAFNLLDNMDGLAAGIAAIAAAFRLLFSYWEADAIGLVVASSLLGSCLGFLMRNFPPARIFMGDAGSQFVGFFLAGVSLIQVPYSRGTVAVLAVPALLLLVPIFDTIFVMATRVFSGRPISVGGRDHTSHRVVAIGASERRVALFFYVVASAAGGVAVISYQAGLSYAALALGMTLLATGLLGVYLAGIQVVTRSPASPAITVVRRLADFQYKRQVLTIALDLALIVFAYYAAYVLRFEYAIDAELGKLLRSLPVILVSQLLAFVGFGLYRGVWRYAGLRDVLRIAQAATVGTMAAAFVLVLTYRFEGFSRAVFIVDWLLLVILIGGSRVSFRLFGELLRSRPVGFERVLIYGAGDGGELTARELLNNPGLRRMPIGFIDDNRSKHGAKIHGLPVLGGSERIEMLLRQHKVGEVIVSSPKIEGNGLSEAVSACERLDVPIRRAGLRLE